MSFSDPPPELKQVPDDPAPLDKALMASLQP